MYVYLGSADGLGTSPDWTMEGDQTNASASGAAAGDVNGDGYDDLAVSCLGYSHGEANDGRVYVYLGSATGPEASPAWWAESDQAPAAFGVVAPAGDVNGDGYADVLVGARDYSHGESSEGAAFLYFGSPAGPSAPPDWQGEGDQTGDEYGLEVRGAGDVTGDGYADILSLAWAWDTDRRANAGALYLGSPTGPSPTADWTEYRRGRTCFGSGLGAAGDVDGDGYDDVVVGAYSYTNGESEEGGAWLSRGTSSGLGTPASWSAEPNQTGAHYRSAADGAGDVNGDGLADVLVGASDFDDGQSNEGRAFLYLGYTDRVDADGDGVDTSVDCDDADASSHPGATELASDGVDQDCDGADLTDVDGDGWVDSASSLRSCDGSTDGVEQGGDCDDSDPDTHPTAPERPGDGRVDAADPPGDCDDAAVHPGAAETCYDGVDNNCVANVDEGGVCDTGGGDAGGDDAGDGTGAPPKVEAACGCGTSRSGSWAALLLAAVGLSRRRGGR